MKAEKVLDKLRDILSAERHAQLKKYKSLKKVLKMLREERRKCAEQLSNETDGEARREIASRLKVISRQREKGLIVLKELKKERKKTRTWER